MKKNYNLHAAIELRGKTWDEAGYYDPTCWPPHLRDEVISFKDSIDTTSQDQMFDWGNIPYVMEVLGSKKRVPREEWYRAHREYRMYLAQAEDRSYTQSDKYSLV